MLQGGGQHKGRKKERPRRESAAISFSKEKLFMEINTEYLWLVYKVPY